MKVSLTLDSFPMAYVDRMVQELKKYLDRFDVQVGGETTVYLTFCSDDIVKIQEACIICDKYRFGGDENAGSVLCGDED